MLADIIDDVTANILDDIFGSPPFILGDPYLDDVGDPYLDDYGDEYVDDTPL